MYLFSVPGVTRHLQGSLTTIVYPPEKSQQLFSARGTASPAMRSIIFA